MEREKKTISGKLLEVDFYSCFADGRQLPKSPKIKKSTAAQEKYNRQKAIKKAIREINANFDNDDLFVHPTYDSASAPQTEEEAEKNIKNFIRRIKTKRNSERKRYEKLCKKYPDNKEYRKNLKILCKEFKFYYRTERTDYKSGAYAGRVNWHYHVFITGGVDRDTVENMWQWRINADRFRPDKFGPEAAARYAGKPAEDDNESVKLHHSRNMVKPITKTKDNKITRRGIEKLCKQRVDDAEYWENRYKGYKFIRTFPRFDNYNSHWYLTVIMYRYDSGTNMPEWNLNLWEE